MGIMESDMTISGLYLRSTTKVNMFQKSDYSYTPTDCVALIKGERVEIKV
jgi:hypothetical protein